MTTSHTTSSTTQHASPPLHESQAEQDVLRLWLRLLTCTTLLENQVSSQLRSHFDTTLPRFDLMAQLARSPGGLGMSELSQRLMVSGGNVTGLTDTLERDGLVERVAIPGDRRAKRVHLTSKGHTAFNAMAREHATWIDTLLAGLSPQEQQQLYSLLGKLKHHVRELE